MHHFRDTTTFVVYVTACHLQISSSFSNKVKITLSNSRVNISYLERLYFLIYGNLVYYYYERTVMVGCDAVTHGAIHCTAAYNDRYTSI